VPPTNQPAFAPALGAPYRWLVVIASVLGFFLRARTHHWDPSLFIQLVFIGFGLGLTSRRLVGDPNERAVLTRMRAVAVVLVAMVIAVSGVLTVVAFAPLVVFLIVLIGSWVLAHTVRWMVVVPIVFALPIGVWAVYAIRAEHDRDRILHLAPADLLRFEMRAPDGSRSVVLSDERDRVDFVGLLARSLPLYPNHEGIDEAWTVRLVLRDGTARSLRLGHGSHSRSSTWIEIDQASDFLAPDRFQDVIDRFAPSPESTPSATITPGTEHR
jgi:hypothetical protein